MIDNLHLHIESLIFVSQKPITLEKIKASLDLTFETSFSSETIQNNILILFEKYQNENFSIEIVEIANGYQFRTKSTFHNTIANYIKENSTKKITKAALETLAIIAYKQPVIKSEIEVIRGVNCDYTIQKLLNKNLIEIVGRSEEIGKPLLYGTSIKFMEHFNLKSIDDLPKIKEVHIVDNIDI